MKGPRRISLRNRSTFRQFVRMEPEGDYINLDQDDQCDIIPDTPSELEFLLVIESENTLAVYSDEWKTVILNGQKVDR